MKQNLIVILLTVVATLLLVDLVENRFPLAANAAIPGEVWSIACTATQCITVSSDGLVHSVPEALSTHDKVFRGPNTINTRAPEIGSQEWREFCNPVVWGEP